MEWDRLMCIVEYADLVFDMTARVAEKVARGAAPNRANNTCAGPSHAPTSTVEEEDKHDRQEDHIRTRGRRSHG